MRNKVFFYKKYICIILVLCCSIFSACGLNGASSSDEISAQYVRTYHNLSTDDSDYLIPTLIQSKSELDAYYENNKDIYSLVYHDDDPKVMDDSIGFLNACEKYDDDYFAHNKLVLVSFMENSGSITHKVTGITFSEENLYIKINRIHPEAGTEDMMGWHIFVELKDCGSLAKDVDIKVTFENVKEKNWFW